jgi:hypothetical protein
MEISISGEGCPGTVPMGPTFGREAVVGISGFAATYRGPELMGISDTVAFRYFSGSRSAEICELGRIAWTGGPGGMFVAGLGGEFRDPESAIPAGLALAALTAIPAAQTAAEIVVSQLLRTTSSPYMNQERAARDEERDVRRTLARCCQLLAISSLS